MKILTTQGVNVVPHPLERVIIAFSGTTPPTGWVFCDGTNGTPDLRNKFIVGAGSSYAVGASGGTNSNTVTHTHGLGTHTHTGATGSTSTYVSSSTTANIDTPSYSVATVDHNHTTTAATVNASADTSGSSGVLTIDNQPAYYTLAFIMRT